MSVTVTHFVPMQTTNVSPEVIIIFCCLSIFLSPLRFFLVSVTNKKLLSENCYFDKVVFLRVGFSP